MKRFCICHKWTPGIDSIHSALCGVCDGLNPVMVPELRGVCDGIDPVEELRGFHFTAEPIDRDYCTSIDADFEDMLANDSIGGC